MGRIDGDRFMCAGCGCGMDAGYYCSTCELQAIQSGTWRYVTPAEPSPEDDFHSREIRFLCDLIGRGRSEDEVRSRHIIALQAGWVQSDDDFHRLADARDAALERFRERERARREEA